MLNNKNAMTVCVDVKHNLDVHAIIDNDIKTIGVHEVYLDGNTVYIGFETKFTITNVAKILKEKLNKSKVKIVGGTIFVRF